MLWMPWSADLVESIDQGIPVAGLERSVEVDFCVSRRAIQRLPVGRGGTPSVLYMYIPKSCRRHRNAPERSGGKYRENREPVVAHN